MLSVDRAIEAILARCQPLPARSIRLLDALGLALAEPIAADLDLPPFDKALMDGYAVRSVDFDGPLPYRLRVVEEIAAGRISARALLGSESARIMTGAPLPPGADAVVPFEQSRPDGPDVLIPGPVRPGQNRMTRGREMKAGDALLAPGAILGATSLGLIASAGRDEVLATPRPILAVVPTGDELVPPSRFPGPGQIRNSNGVMLAALARSWGATDVRERPIAPDDSGPLKAALLGAIDGSDVAIICGGVSAGRMDLVPPTLEAIGVEPVFHKVSVKPGKPIWFGVAPRPEGRPPTLVFGLPGNPVGAVVGFLLFVRPALDALSALPPRRPDRTRFPLAIPFNHRGDRPTYHPARLDEGRLRPMDWAGSADLRTVALADGFAIFPPGEQSHAAGDEVGFLPLR